MSEKCHHQVVRYCFQDPVSKLRTGDFLRVGEIDLGPFRDLTEAEYARAKRANPWVVAVSFDVRKGNIDG